jgi:hypothetical protein
VPRYTMRLCWGEDSPDDYSLLVDGKPAGRCYQMRAAYGRDVWRWTVYGISGGGIEDTLAEAQRRFKETYEAAKHQYQIRTGAVVSAKASRFFMFER